MEPFEQQFGRKRNINFQAIGAFVVAVVVAYFVQKTMDFRGGNLFTMLIVVAIGGGWYHLKKIV